MNRSLASLLYTATFAVGATGLVYGAMAYCMVPEDEFALVNHAWQPTVHAAHVATAPLSVFAFGVAWASHVVPKLRAGGRARRRTGLLLLPLVLLMVVSGYAVQVATDAALREVCIWGHGITSLAFLAVFALHVAGRLHRRGASSTPSRTRQEAPAAALRGSKR